MSQDVIQALQVQRADLQTALESLANQKQAHASERARTRKSRARNRLRQAVQAKHGVAPADEGLTRRAPRQARRPRGLAAAQLRTETQLLLLNALLKQEERIAFAGLEAVVENLRQSRLTTEGRERTKAVQDYALAFLDDLLLRFARKETRKAAGGPLVMPWYEDAVRADVAFLAGVQREGVRALQRFGSEHAKFLLDRDRAELAVLERFLGSHSLGTRATFLRYAKLIALEVAAPKQAHDGKLYCQAWREAVEKLSRHLLARYQG
jgi:hypothetical protein